MKETLPTTPVEQHDENGEAIKYSPDELEQITSASHGAEDVLERAISAGEPSHKVVETDGGIKGFVEAGIPGGRVEATFDGTGESARLEEVNMILGDDGESHEVGIQFKESGEALIFVDGEPVKPEEVPAVAAVIEQLKVEQLGDVGPDTSSQASLEYISSQTNELEAIATGLGDIDLQLSLAQEKLLSTQAELGDFGEKLGKLFEILLELIDMLKEQLDKIANEKDEDKKEQMERSLQEKIEEFVQRLEQI